MPHYVMKGNKAIPTGHEYPKSEDAPDVPGTDTAPAPKATPDHMCQYCTPPRPFSSQHALKTHQGKMHSSQMARKAYEDSIRVRKEENAEREANS